MTKKEEETQTENIADKPTKGTNKRILIELVAESPIREFKIIGALARAGLLQQYEKEKIMYGKYDITPSITEKDFNKLLSDFLG